MPKASSADSRTRLRIALIDADSIVYATALGAEMKLAGDIQDAEIYGKSAYIQIKSEEECYTEIVSKLEALVGDVKADDAIVCLTTTKCFRYDVLPSYKGNRSGMHRPSMLLELQALVQERRPFGVLAVRGLEADDVCAISSGHLQAAPYRDPVVVSIDKDLKSVPGLVYSPMKHQEGIVEVTTAMADRAFLYQTLVGDPVDGYGGAHGIGPKKANKLLDDCSHLDMETQWAWIEAAFRKRGQTEQDALTQARVARIVRSEEWNQKTRQVHLWSPGSTTPTILNLDDLPHLRDQ